MKKVIVSLIILPLIILCFGCKDKHSASATKPLRTFVAKPVVSSSTLYFQSNVEPLETIPVRSPNDGIISKLNFSYGEAVKKGQSLFFLSSTQLQSDYFQALTDFLKAKQQYAKSKVDFEGTKALWNYKAISYEDYLNDKDAYNAARFDFLQARFKLEKYHGGKYSIEDLEKMSLEDVNKLAGILQQHARQVEIKSPISGIALIPESAGSSDGSTQTKVKKGDEVKKNQAVLSVGDLSGITLRMSASEIHINHIKLGDAVTITGDAFPNEVLSGKVVDLSLQSASADMEGGVARYPVKVMVSNLTKAQRDLIHVGMTAQVKLVLKTPPQIMVPLDAIVSAGQDTAILQVMDPKSKKISKITVKTGATTLNRVVILGGLNAGDTVVYP